MTTTNRSLPTESASILGATLHDVYEAITARTDLSDQARSNLRAALNTLGRVLDRPAHHIPAALNLLRPMMEKSSPGAIHVSPRHWANVRSNVIRAIRLCGLAADFVAVDVPIAEVWLPVIARAQGRLTPSFLRRFARFCSSRQIAPTAVNDDLMPDYLTYLTNVGSTAALACRNDLIRVWNRIRGSSPDLNLAMLTRIDKSRTYTLAWSELPATLATDAATFKAAIVRVDPLADDVRPPVRPATANQYDRQLRRLASAALAHGVTTEDIGTLADLIRPAIVKRALEYFLERNDNEVNQQVHDMAHLALTIAKHYAKLPEVEVNRLKRLARKCKLTREGLTAKNRKRLQQFRDQGVIKKFCDLPYKLLNIARKNKANSRTAILVQSAVEIAILFVAPMRLANLRSLDRTRHFQPSFSTKHPGMQIFLPAEEVKNNIDLQFPLPQEVMTLIDIYMSEYQPLLCGESECSLLFPGRGGKPKSEGKVREQIVATVWKHLGIHINPHLFRHLAAMIFLDAHPGAYEEVRRFLGHKSLQTTINFYAGLETSTAVKRYHEVLDSYRTVDKGKAA